MVDPRVVIHVLTTRNHVQAVERALDALSIENGVHVVPDQGAAKVDGMGREIAAVAQGSLNCGDMERLLTLPLQLVMSDHRALARDDFRDDVGKIEGVVQTDVALDDHRLAVIPRENQVPGMRDNGLPAPS
jgi:hypothetical protein